MVDSYSAQPISESANSIISMLKSLVLFSLLSIVLTVSAFGEQLPEDHKILIEELVALIDDEEEFQQKVRTYHHELALSGIDRMFAGTILEDDLHAINIIRKTIDSLIDREFSEGSALKEIHYQSFSRDLTKDELQALLTFYRTDIGRKVLEAESGLFNEWKRNRHIWARSLQGEIRRRIKIQLNAYHNKKLGQVNGPD